MQIREASLRQDFDWLVHMDRQPDNNPIGFNDIVYHLTRDEGNHRRIFVAVDERSDKIMGYVCVIPARASNKARLKALYVLPDYRHKGVGQSLLKHAESIAMMMFKTGIYVEIEDTNEVGRKFVLLNGYQLMAHNARRYHSYYNRHALFYEKFF